MKPFYQDNHDTIYCQDFRQNELPDESVQCVVTSPPYWGLRRYSGEQELIWGGDKDCPHTWIEKTHMHNWERNQSPKLGISGDASASASGYQKTNFCSLCGAWKGAYGLEPTPEMYIEHTIEILREIRRVLRKDGVVFWNIGDSYASSGLSELAWSTPLKQRKKRAGTQMPNRNLGNLKPKDLCLIPFRVAIAAQEDGWWVISDIIWDKPNPMPESTTKRPTRSHEYILMLVKNASKVLYWTHRDGGGTRDNPKADYRWVNQITKEEVAIEPSDWKQEIPCPDCEATGKVNVYLGLDVWQEKQCPTCNGKKVTQLWKRINLWRGHDYYWDADAVREPHHYPPHSPGNRGGFESRVNGQRGEWGEFKEPDRVWAAEGGRNIRSVWEFPTQPYPEAHFAVFPEKLPEICIKAATPEVGCCSKCGAPWERITKVSRSNESYWGKQGKTPEDVKGIGKYGDAVASDGDRKRAGSDIRLGPIVSVETLGWQPTCKCNADKVPSICLDPFAGAGTTLWVAKKLNRKAIGYEISEEYCQLAMDRCRQQVLL